HFGLVGIPSSVMQLSANHIDVNVNGATVGNAIDFSKIAGFGVQAGGTTIPINFSQALIEASGDVTLTIAAVGISTHIPFQKPVAADGPQAIQVAFIGLDLHLGSTDFNLPGASGAFYIGRGGVAGQITINNLAYSVGDSCSQSTCFGLSFSASATFSFNTSSAAVN